jgi:hypothetical protein
LAFGQAQFPLDELVEGQLKARVAAIDHDRLRLGIADSIENGSVLENCDKLLFSTPGSPTRRLASR